MHAWKMLIKLFQFILYDLNCTFFKVNEALPGLHFDANIAQQI